VPLPFGGKARQIMVDLDQEALFAKGLSPIDVSNAVNAQNVILPSGTARLPRTRKPPRSHVGSMERGSRIS